MPLTMARPMRRKNSSFHQFRKRIPLDVLNAARGKSIALPIGTETVPVVIGDKAVEITASLRTRDPREAKERQATVLSYLDAFWEALRNPPTRLSHKQILALGGEAYRDVVEAYEDDPGETAIWAALLRKNATVVAQGQEAMEKWFGLTVDQKLAEHRLNVDDESRDAVLDQIGVAITRASARLGQNASGDYSPDIAVNRYPAFERPKEAPKAARRGMEGQTITGLAASWWLEAKASGKSQSTYESYERAARLLSEFLEHDDAQAVTEDDVIRFKDHRLSQGVSIKTITASDLSGIRVLFQWGIDNRKLNHNPAKDIKVAKVKRKRTRDPGFSDEEAKIVLSHAWFHQRAIRESEHLFNARRWVPWLCAYSGARVGEMVQLRAQDIRREGDLWVMTITPEANTVKDSEYREVPLHPHLVEMGFPQLAQRQKSGYLFMAPSSSTHDAIRGAWRATKNRVTDFIRQVITDPGVQPSHAWRHRFMTVGRELGIPKDVRFAITGHATKDEGDDYGSTTNKAKAAALAKYPRYPVNTARP